jgi:uncharacterized DUF497 family protein
MSCQYALDQLRRCWDFGWVRNGPHFRRELANDGLDLQDVEAVLRSGAIYKPAEIDPRRGEWKYTLEGRCEGGRWIAVVFVLKARDEAFLVTVWRR